MSDVKKDDTYGISFDRNKQRKKRGKKRKSDDYTSFTPIELVYHRSHIYGGSEDAIEQSLPYFDKKLKRIIKKAITTPDLLSRFFIEGITNASDNAIKSRLAGTKSDFVIIDVDKKSMHFRNDGLPIPLTPHKKMCKKEKFGTAVDLIFGKIGSGSNLDDDYERESGGVNGVGCKLQNIFSIYYRVMVGDNINGVEQTAEWCRNMCTKKSSTCKPAYVQKKDKNGNSIWKLDKSEDKYTDENYVDVYFEVDFRKFEQNKIRSDDIAFFKALACITSYSAKIKIQFNGEMLDYRDINDYAKLFAEDVKDKLVIYSFPEETEIPEDKKEKAKKIKNGSLVPEIELCMICNKSAESDFSVACTNGVYNKDGGIHTVESYKSVMSVIKKVVANDKSFGISKDEVKRLTVALLKKNVTLLLNFNCVDPKFESQMKNELKKSKTKPKIRFNEENVKTLKKWELMNIIYDKFHETNGKTKKRKRIVDEKFRDASYVGKKGAETVLLACEGKSAGEYLDEYIMELKRLGKGGYKLFAKYPMRGKLKNISGMSTKDIDAPEKSGKENELVRFMNIVGLVDGVDYTDEKNAEKLHYKYVRIMVDADSDGSHILCLLINFFYRRFPSFIKAGRLSWCFTPIMRITKPGSVKTIKRIYNMADYEKWVKKHPNVKHDVEYFKGLAAASPEQAREDARESPNVVLWFDKKADFYLNIAFDQCKGSAAKRKAWMLKFKNCIDKEIIKNDKHRGFYAKISDIINTKLIEYSFDSIVRAIPGEDQLKHSVRLGLAWMIEKFNFGKSKAQAEKLEHMANTAATEFKYHHGAVSLISAIARRTLDYAGESNYLLADHVSMTGSRHELGENMGAGRYTKTRISKNVKYILPKYLYDIVERNVVEGKRTEPKMIPFIVPVSVMNGCKGVSTGWSTYLTNYNPKDVGKFVYNLICEKKVFPMVPWFTRFNGNVELEMKRRKKEKNEDETDSESEDENDEDNEKGEFILVLKTEGIFKIKKQYDQEITIEEPDPDNYGENIKVTKTVTLTDFVITEVPIGVNATKLLIQLKKMSDDAFMEPDDSYTPYIKVKGYRGSMEPHKIGMVSRRMLSNITFVSNEGIPICYENVYQCIVSYCETIKQLYHRRREIKLRELREKLQDFEHRAFLIKKVKDKEWKFIDRTREEIKSDLRGFKIPYEVFSKIKNDEYTKEGYKEILKEIKNLKKEIENVEKSDVLGEWKESLLEFMRYLDSDPIYEKKKIHQYKVKKCKIEDLTSGKILAPYTPKIISKAKSATIDETEE